MIRVAITTDRFESAAVPFRGCGFQPVMLPCIRVEPAASEVLTEAREAASWCDLLLVTSVRTLDLLWPGGSMPAVDVAAVGERTSDGVAIRGGRVLVSGRAGLADLMLQLGDRLASSRVIFPRGSTPDPVGADSMASDSNAGIPKATLDTLRAQAADLREFEVYRTTPQPPGLDGVDAAVFASPSAVAGWQLSRSFDDLVVGVIGSTTRQAMAAHRPPDVVAPQPTHQALAMAMASYLEVSA